MNDRPDIDCFADTDPTTAPFSAWVVMGCILAACIIAGSAAFLCAISVICKGE